MARTGINGFNVGRNLTVQVVSPQGTLTLSGKTAVDFRQIVQQRVHHGLDGKVSFINIPAGWQGTIELDRRDDEVDSFFAAAEAGYYAGEAVDTGSVTETISNPDGTVSQYLFTDAVLTLPEGGNWRGDDKVMMRLDVHASTRERLA